MSVLGALTALDTIAVAVCLVFAVRGALKGFAWQAFRTVGLIAAVWAAVAFRAPVGRWIDDKITFIPSATAPWIALLVLFLGVFLLATYFAWMARGALKSVKLTGPDRAFGFVLGAVMGLVFLTIGFFVWGQFVASDDDLREALEGSRVGRPMAELVNLVEPHLPGDVVEKWDHIIEMLDDVTGADD